MPVFTCRKPQRSPPRGFSFSLEALNILLQRHYSICILHNAVYFTYPISTQIRLCPESACHLPDSRNGNKPSPLPSSRFEAELLYPGIKRFSSEQPSSSFSPVHPGKAVQWPFGRRNRRSISPE